MDIILRVGLSIVVIPLDNISSTIGVVTFETLGV